MSRLTIEKQDCTRTMDTMKITGFADGELEELKNLPHRESGEKLLEMLDKRNDGIGSTWHNGYGVWSHWFDEEAAYVNIGRNCD